MRNVLLNKAERKEMRRKVAQQSWAADILAGLQQSIQRDPRQPETAYETVQPYTEAKALSRQARDMALVHVITGDETPLEKMIDHFRSEFRLDAMDQILDAEAPASIGRLNAKNVKNWHPSQWSYGLMRGSFFYAYDLTREHAIWQQDGLGKRFEQRLREVLDVVKPMEAGVRGWGNCQTWYAGTCALLGAMLDDAEALDLAIDGPLGFKAILGLLLDNHFWPEPISYGHHYVKCVLTIIAEVARHSGREDLYRWETDEGVSLKGMYDGFVELLFADGRLAAHGDGSGTSEQLELIPPAHRFTTWSKPADKLWGHDFNRNANTFEIAHRAYGDPRYAWILAQQPGRDSWDHEFWGYTALTHGVPLQETTPPEARSHCWRAFGAALMRGDESPAYWHGSAPAVYLRRGEKQGHGDSDGGHILLNAHGRTLYPDSMIKWNYQGRVDPDTGKNVNPTPYSKLRIAHNTVSVDCSEPRRPHMAQLGAVRRCGPMKIVTFYDVEAKLRRTLGLTPEYVLDWFCCGGVIGPDKKQPHTYDYHLHGLGLPELEGVEALQPYTTLGEEYGLGVIDTRSDAPDNQWIRPGQAGCTDDSWQAIMREERPREPAAPRGVRIHAL